MLRQRITMQQWNNMGFKIIKLALRMAFRSTGTTLDKWLWGDNPPEKPNPKKMNRLALEIFLLNHYENKDEIEIRNAMAKKTDEELRVYVKNIINVRPIDKERTEKLRKFEREVRNTIREYSPYESLYEVYHAVHNWFGEKIGNAFATALPILSEKIFGKYDFVVFTETNDDIGEIDPKTNRLVSAYEVVIYNPALQKTVNENRHKYFFMII